jgi:hypothetical protein
MTTLTYDSCAESSYFANIGCAARNLLAALPARQPKPAAEVSQRSKLKNLEMMFQMADQYQAFSPNLAAELRFMASRG